MIITTRSGRPGPSLGKPLEEEPQSTSAAEAGEMAGQPQLCAQASMEMRINRSVLQGTPESPQRRQTDLATGDRQPH